MSGRKLIPYLLAVLTLVPLLAAPASLAQQENRRAAAFGIEVRQGRKAMPGVEVRLESEGPVRGTSPEPRVTDAEGRAEFWWLTPGIWRVDLLMDGEVAYFLTVRINPGRRAEEMGSPARDVDAPDLRWKFFRPKGEPPPPPPPPARAEPEPPVPEAAAPEAAEPAPEPAPPQPGAAEPEAMQPEAEPTPAPEPTPEPAMPEPATPEPQTPEPAMEEPEAAEAAAPEPAEESPAESVTPPPMIPDPTPPPTEDPTDEEPELAVDPQEAPAEPRSEEESTPPPMIPEPAQLPGGDTAAEEPAATEPPAPEPVPESAPEPAPEPAPVQEPEAMPAPTAEPTPEPTAEAAPAPAPVPQPAAPVEDAAEDLPLPPEAEPEPVAAAPVEPAPMAGPRFTSGSGAGGDCPQCKASESSVTLERTVPPGDPGGGATCGPDMARAALEAARRLASRGEGLGPGMPLDGGELARYTGSGASCQVLGVVLPPGVRYRGYTYSVETGGDAGGPCYLPRACPVAGAIWTARPVIEELGSGAQMVYGVFRNAAAVPLRAKLQIFYVED